ncbi:hypothetical protein HHI36_007972, partial [Cryptolaemus montrouzieri]
MDDGEIHGAGEIARVFNLIFVSIGEEFAKKIKKKKRTTSVTNNLNTQLSSTPTNTEE